MIYCHQPLRVVTYTNLSSYESAPFNKVRLSTNRLKRELAALARMCLRPTILSSRCSLVSFLPRQQQTIINLHHNSRFASQILYRFKKAQIPHFWSLEICAVDSTPPTSLQLLLHNSPSQPTSNSVTAKSVDRDSKYQ